MRSLKMVMVLFVLAMVAGCGSGGKGSNPTQAPAPAQNPAPAQITGVGQSTLTAGGPAFTLIVNGENFTEASVVKVDGVVRSDAVIVSPTQISIPMSASDLATPGTKVITVDAATVTLTVKEQPWFTATNCPAQKMVKANDGLLYAAYAKDGDVYLCRFDANGERVPIGEYSDVHVTVDAYSERAAGIAVFGGYAYIMVFRELPNGAGFGEGILERVNLITGSVRDDNASIIMQGGILTGFASDNVGVVYIAFNFNGQLGEYKSAVVGVNVADMKVVFEEGWTNSPRITAIAVDAASIYMGGTATNSAGEQARTYVRKESRATKELRWESQIGTIAASPNDDTFYPGSFVLDTAQDALYFSGALGYLTDAPRGVVAKIKASSPNGDFDWAFSAPNTMAYALAPMAVDEAGGLYGYSYESDSIVRMDPLDPSNRQWSATHALQPNCITAAGGVVYMPYPSGKIIRLTKAGGAVIN